jgi:hydrogenase-4 component E
MVLVLIFLALAATMKAPQLFLWAGIAFVTKAVLVPLILYRALAGMGDTEMPKGILGPMASIVLAAAAVAISYSVVDGFELRAAEPFTPALAVSVAHFFFGLLCILTQRNILKQVQAFV